MRARQKQAHRRFQMDDRPQASEPLIAATCSTRRTMTVRRKNLLVGILVLSVVACASEQPIPQRPSARRDPVDLRSGAPPPEATTDIGTYRICVDTAGAVSTVDAVQPFTSSKLDVLMRRKLRSWKFRPLIKNGVAVAFCYQARIDARPTNADQGGVSRAVTPDSKPDVIPSGPPATR